MKKIKPPKDVKGFVENLIKVILDVPISLWSGVALCADGTLNRTLDINEPVDARSSGCLVQQALGKEACKFSDEYGYAHMESDFLKVAPFLKPYAANVEALVGASDTRNVTRAIKETLRLAARVEIREKGVTIDTSRLV